MKDQEFRKFYNSLMGMKSEHMAYTFWCAGWDAAQEALKAQDTQHIKEQINYETI